ncbi:MAG TPA: SDR family NAD(P)-dependent oxidoreductase [Terriglobales bacterium]|nr:SDR family NAD(P)-dependent oxidoreductase [Terriglobales bacterium]
MSNTGRYAQYPSLQDKVVLITGGATGIGASIVEHFAAQGSRVAFLDVDESGAAKLIDSSAGANHAPVFLRCDLTDIAGLRLAIQEVDNKLGTVNVLVNNAARDDRHKTAEVTPEYWDERMAVNLRHQFFATQAVAPGMTRSGGGSIINMSSISWIIPSTGLPAYVTAKAGIVGLTRTLSREFGEANIRVNCVLPGAIMTERQRKLWFTPEYLAEVMKAQALKRELVPEDVARLVLFLASDDSASITGQNFIIDGGWV